MRNLKSLIAILFLFSLVVAQDHGDWREFRSEADGFSIEFPGTPKTSSNDLSEGQTQKFFTVELGPETYMASVVQLNSGGVPADPDQAYFETLLKAYTDGSKTTLRSSRKFIWAGRSAIEGISDDESATHVIDITTAGDRIYLAVFAGAKGKEGEAKATHMRDSFKLLGK